MSLVRAVLMVLTAGSPPDRPRDPCPPPSAYPGRPYFDFQVDQPAVYLARDSVHIKPIEQRTSQPYPPDFALAQFVVDSLGVPVPGTLKLLIQPSGLSKDDDMMAPTE